MGGRNLARTRRIRMSTAAVEPANSRSGDATGARYSPVTGAYWTFGSVGRLPVSVPSLPWTAQRSAVRLRPEPLLCGGPLIRGRR